MRYSESEAFYKHTVGGAINKDSVTGPMKLFMHKTCTEHVSHI